MTLQEFIDRLEELKATHGPEMPILWRDYPGEMRTTYQSRDGWHPMFVQASLGKSPLSPDVWRKDDKRGQDCLVIG